MLNSNLRLWTTQGFTLIELLLAITLLSIIGSASFQLIASSSSSLTKIQSMDRKAQRLINLHWALRNDLHQFVMTPLARTRRVTPIEFGGLSGSMLKIHSPTSSSYIQTPNTGVSFDDSYYGTSIRSVEGYGSSVGKMDSWSGSAEASSKKTKDTHALSALEITLNDSHYGEFSIFMGIH